MASYTFGYGGAYGYRGSLSLAQILYQTSLGDFTYNTDSSGNVVLTNQGNLGASYDGLPYSGRGIELGATNDVDIPIHHTLGSELVTNGTFDTDTDWTKGTGWTIAAGVASSDGTQVADSLLTTSTIPTTVSGDTYLISFEVTAYTAGNVALQFDGIEIIPDKAAVGVYSAEAIASDITGTVDIVADLNFVGSVDNVTVKQITNPNSYLTYYDFTDGLVTLGNSVDGGSSEELVDTANDLSEWTVYGTNIVEEDVDGAIKVTYVDNASGAFVNIRETGGLSKDFIIGRTYQVIFTSKINTGAANVRVYDGVSNDTLLTNTEYQTFSVEIVPTSVAAYINFPAMGAGEVVWIKDISVKEILPISTKYTINTKTINNVITHTTNWSALDWSKINNNPNLVGKLAVETLGATKTIAELDMELDQGANADSYYMCSEKSGAYLVDSRNIGSELVTNGDFDTTTTGWTAQGVASLSIESGRLKITSTGTGGFGASQTVSTTAGKTYILLSSMQNSTADSTQLRVSDGTGLTGDIYLPTAFTDTLEHDIITIFTAISSQTTIYNRLSASAVGQIGYLDNVSVREATATEIDNYTDTVRTNADLQQKGIQTTAFVTDGAGVPTSFTGNILNFTSLEYIDTQWNPSLETEFWLEEVIDGVVYQHNYDGVNLTTYTDNVAGAPVAHSPENASYLLGKGVYPKVTADPYTSYQSKTFAVYTGSRYTSYDQPARYTILAAL